MPNTHTYTKTQNDVMTRSTAPPQSKEVRFDNRFLVDYVSSWLRLLIFATHCGPDHPCTQNEAKILRRYDSVVNVRHAMLNVRKEHSAFSSALCDHLVWMARNVIDTFELEPEFEEEILAKFAKTAQNRFSAF